MREDYLEKLEKMFPDGYVIIYTCPNKKVRINLYNPDGFEELQKVKDYILDSDIFQEKER